MYSKVIFSENYLPFSVKEFVEKFTGNRCKLKINIESSQVIFEYDGQNEQKFILFSNVFTFVIKNLAKEDLLPV